MSNIGCILYPPTLDYYYLVQRPQQLMKSFSQLNIPTYYLNWNSSNVPKEGGVKQLNPYFFLFDNVDPKPYLQNIRPVVYYTAASHVNMIKDYNPSLVVFDSVDEPSEEFEGWKPFYNQAVASADVVLTTSDKLFHMARAINPKTFLVPNGCDFEYFSQSSKGNLPVPADIANIKKPIIGYIGVIATWCDMELIDKVAVSYPNYNLVMIGPFYNTTDVPRRDNVHWLGFKKYEDLAAYAQMFDVGIIPFKRTSMVESVNPIKMWEYMAAGIPIVTSAIPETRKFQDLVLYSETHEQFIQNIQRAINNDTPELKARRIQLAQQNSWLSRAQLIVSIIEQELQNKNVQGGQPPAKVNNILSFKRGVSATGYTQSIAPFTKLNISGKPSIKFSIKAGGVVGDQRSSLIRASGGFNGRPQQFTVTGKVSFKYITTRGQVGVGVR